jgi:hypothetical protein
VRIKPAEGHVPSPSVRVRGNFHGRVIGAAQGHQMIGGDGMGSAGVADGVLRRIQTDMRNTSVREHCQPKIVPESTVY